MNGFSISGWNTGSAACKTSRTDAPLALPRGGNRRVNAPAGLRDRKPMTGVADGTGWKPQSKVLAGGPNEAVD